MVRIYWGDPGVKISYSQDNAAPIHGTTGNKRQLKRLFFLANSAHNPTKSRE
jgi:hypothetical protein